jgi:hypothetical protein
MFPASVGLITTAATRLTRNQEPLSAHSVPAGHHLPSVLETKLSRPQALLPDCNQSNHIPLKQSEARHWIQRRKRQTNLTFTKLQTALYGLPLLYTYLLFRSTFQQEPWPTLF